METMQRLQLLKDECLKELEQINVLGAISKNITYDIDYHSLKHLGTTTRNGKDFIIKISEWVLNDLDDCAIKNVIIHELLHTINGAFCHTGAWKSYANYVNAHTDYHISRTENITKLYQKVDKMETYQERFSSNKKYSLYCKTCGCTWYQSRITKQRIIDLKNGNCIHASCQGKWFELVDMQTGEILVG